ncbi:FKBP-type peptidyl-prolyl cis-trans isomerase [Arenicella sp. 4NH20-0111]|uniref:FKBP-type peptidyl-prolyl cis-trans isomerase n=1 Tax=Arenicella sp. 4NH20-0111 TaxID=3127648 RepID=UPI0033410137
MNFKKKMTVAAGMVAMVGTAYVGSGLLPVSNVAFADSKAVQAGSKIDLSNEASKLGYMYGVRIASDMKRGGLDSSIDVDAIEAAFRDVFSGTDLQMSEEDMVQVQQAYQQKMQDEYQAMIAKNSATSAAFMEKNAKEKGIVTTESGLQYKVVRAGKGKQPSDTDTVKVHYEGKLIDGTKFDSSYDRGTPADFPVSGVIPGFSEGLQAMKEGAKYTLFIPASQAYGENAPPTIGPNQALVFEVELIEVVSQADAEGKKTS